MFLPRAIRSYLRQWHPILIHWEVYRWIGRQQETNLRMWEITYETQWTCVCPLSIPVNWIVPADPNLCEARRQWGRIKPILILLININDCFSRLFIIILLGRPLPFSDAPAICIDDCPGYDSVSLDSWMSSHWTWPGIVQGHDNKQDTLYKCSSATTFRFEGSRGLIMKMSFIIF